MTEIKDLLHTDLHMHTIFCDGANTPEEMVCSALEKGMNCIGFSGHSFVSFDPSAGMSEEAEQKYLKEVHRLQKTYEGRIRILCGTELDYHTLPEPGTNEYRYKLEHYKKDYEYLIGSVHYLPTPVPAAVDDTPEIFVRAVQKYYDGDYYAAAEAYFSLEADVVRRTDCDIIGHFDLVSKFNQTYHFFDEQHPRYRTAWQKAADQLLKEHRLFEINTGGMARGWRDVPYPAPPIQEYLRQKGARMIYSSDSHHADTIGYRFGLLFHRS